MWHNPTETPPVKLGECNVFVVAVSRAHNGKTYTFPCCYLNGYGLYYDECKCANEHEDGCPTIGWYMDEPGDDYEGTYTKLSIKEGDEFLGWCELPRWIAP